MTTIYITRPAVRRLRSGGRGSTRGATLATALAALLTIAAAAPLAALPAGAVLGREALATLSAGGDLRAAAGGRGAAPSLTPDHPAARALRDELASEAPDVVVEALFLWRKPRAASPAAELLETYNVLRAIGTLQGIEYYSASRKAMRLFYEYSSLVDGPETKRPTPDRRLEALPRAETLYARQKDLSFGDNIYRYDFTSGADYIASLSTNLTTMRYGIVPVAAPEALKVRSLAILVDEGVVFYAVSSAKAAVVPGVRAKLESSFGNRAEAVYDWFAAKAEAAWRRLP